MNLLETVFGLILANSGRVALLVIAFLALRRVLRRFVPAAALYAVWILVAAKLLLPGGLATAWSPYNLLRAGAPMRAALPAFTLPKAAVPRPMAAPSPLAPVPVAPAPPAQPPISWVQISALVWLAVAAGLIARRFAAGVLLRRNILRGEIATEGRVRQIVGACSVEEGFARPVRVRTTDAVATPALFGLLRPTLLVPPALPAQLSDDELRLVVRHELAHCRRGDLLSKAVIELAAIAHWFNPAARLALRAARVDCELACDERVLRRATPEVRADYGATLLKVLRLDPGATRPSAALGILEDREQFKQRIQMIISHQRTGAAHLVSGAALLAVAAILTITQESQVRAAEAPRSPGPAVRAQLEQQIASISGEIDALHSALEEKRRKLEDLKAILGGGRQVLDMKDVPAATYVRVNREFIDALGITDLTAARNAADEARKAAEEARKNADEIARQMVELRQSAAVRQVDQRRAEQAMRQAQDQIEKLRTETASLQSQGDLDAARARLAETQAMGERLRKVQEDQANADRTYAAARAVEQARIEAEQQRAAMEAERDAQAARAAQLKAEALGR